MKNQITKTLPRSAWQDVIIKENYEPLVEVKETYRLRLGLIQKSYELFFWVRKSVAEKLARVSKSLPKGINLVLIEGYRTLKSQQDYWNRIFRNLKEENPGWTDDKIEQQTRLVVAKPSPLANHHCGGAVDVTLAYSNGTLLDMGTYYPSKKTSIEIQKKFPMLSDRITEEQKANRKVLRDAMEKEGFVWYPHEWWHYCFGDRMWAVYTKQKQCFYGPAYLPIPYVKFLTRDEINAVPVQENGEELIDIPITERILHREGDGKKWLVAKLRKSVVEMLVKASKTLPPNYKFVVMSAYIPVSMQQQIWNRKMKKTKLQNPDVTDEAELEKLNRKYAAYPTKGAPHNTGGAVDVIIIDENNQPLDMGSPFGGVGKPNHTRYDDITDEQRHNRQMLYWTMENAGFRNTNPFEWWHYSYGDRAWAAYQGEQFAFYGGI